MTPEEIPAELKEIIDRRAGRIHSNEGRVMKALAEILTRYREMLLEEINQVKCHDGLLRK